MREPQNAMERVEAGYLARVVELQAQHEQISPLPKTPAKRPFCPRISRLDPDRYHGDRWAIDGRSSERYTAKTWRMVMHVLHATVFG